MIAYALGVDVYYLKTGIETLLCGDKAIHEVAGLMQTMISEGKAVVLDKARDAAREYPKSEPKAA